MNLRYLFALTLVGLLLAGCGDSKTAENTPGDPPATATTNEPSATATGKTVVGQWTVKEMPGFEVEFKEDGTMTANLSQVPNMPNAKILTASTYKVDGDKITTTGTSGTVEGVDDNIKKQMEEGMKAELGKPVSGTIKWISDTEFTVTADATGAVITYQKA